MKSHTFLAYSQAVPGREPGYISGYLQDSILELAERMTVGYVSFRYGIPVADVVRVLEESREQS